MASKDNIFTKHLPNIKLATRFNAEGREIAVEIRKDDEQLAKYQEIIDLLVAAGYFRARIKGLSEFDKIVGGMTWCIEACDYDVDVDLLFNENLNIKQKIALTEKIVSVLEQMSCPHTIEPHQIQGNDFINVFPVVQWLVKKSVENRTEKAEKLKRFAISQFHNEFTLGSDKQQKEKHLKILKNVQKVQDTFAPRRQFKRKDSPPEDEKTRVRITLLEYGNRGSEIVATGSAKAIASLSGQANESFDNEMQDEIDVEQLLQVLAETHEADDYEAFEELSEVEKSAIQKHYEDLKHEMSIDSHQLSEKNQLKVILATKVALEKRLEKILHQNQQLQAKVDENNASLAQISAEKEQLRNEITEIDQADLSRDETGIINQVQELVIANEKLKQQETEYKENCKRELVELQQNIKDSEDLTPEGDIDDLQKELEKEKENLQVLRLQMAKKNRQCVALQRQLDNIPDRTELSQYQRRFLELYNQISAKHRETKQFYTLYNTLEDSKRYLEKEMSILNSIYDNYNDAMLTPNSKDQFMVQFEQIAEGIKQTKSKAQAKCDEEKAKRDNLNDQLLTLVDQQRKYAAAIKQFTIECQRNEALHMKLESMI